MTYGELPAARPSITLPSGGTITPRQPVLLCPRCRQTFSANRSDYWLVDPQTVIKHCGRAMRLVEEVTRFVEVK